MKEKKKTRKKLQLYVLLLDSTAILLFVIAVLVAKNAAIEPPNATLAISSTIAFMIFCSFMYLGAATYGVFVPQEKTKSSKNRKRKPINHHL